MLKKIRCQEKIIFFHPALPAGLPPLPGGLPPLQAAAAGN